MVEIHSNRLEIRKIASDAEAKICAEIMSSSEPWITYRFTYEMALEYFMNKTFEIYVAMSSGKIVGFLVIEKEGTFTGYIKSIGVHTAWRGKGVGKHLMQYAEDKIFAVKPNVFLCVSSFNTEAKMFYEKLGYETIGELKDFLLKGYSEILMRKSISSILEFRGGKK
jgi:ribosomal protein S18 acetylase RimI-like enzyme